MSFLTSSLRYVLLGKTMLSVIICYKLFDAVKVKVHLLIRQIIFIKSKWVLKSPSILKIVVYSNHLHLKRHLGVVQKPILCKKAYMVVALDKSKVCTDIKLILVFTRHLEKDLFLSQESAFVLKMSIRLKYRLIEISLTYKLALEHWLNIVLLLIFLGNLIIFIPLNFQWYKARVLKPRNTQWHVKIAKRVQEKRLNWRVHLHL